MVQDERDHHAEGSQNEEGKWDKVWGWGENQELSEGKAGQAWVEAGKGPPPPRYTQSGGEEGHDQDRLGVVVGLQRVRV